MSRRAAARQHPAAIAADRSAQCDRGANRVAGERDLPFVGRLRAGGIRSSRNSRHLSPAAAHLALVLKIIAAMRSQLLRPHIVDLGNGLAVWVSIRRALVRCRPAARQLLERPGLERTARFQHQIPMRWPRVVGRAVVIKQHEARHQAYSIPTRRHGEPDTMSIGSESTVFGVARLPPAIWARICTRFVRFGVIGIK